MNFGNGSGGGNAVAGPELAQIDTELLTFQAASGDDKLQLLPSAWPLDNLPPPTSSMLSIASTKGLVAAAGPGSLVIARTQSVREAFVQGAANEHKVKSFTPQTTLQIPRVTQVAFSSDESCLVIAAEQGGGLAVYDTNALANGSQLPAFQLSTEGQAVRQLLPNPNPTPELSRFFGIVTDGGKLLLADLKEKKLITSSNGSQVFHDSVTCACWSRLGKQIVAGLANGTAVQVDQQGVVKATIPEPPQLAHWKDSSATAHPVTSILWLETHDFLTIHTPVNPPDTMGNDDSIYHLAHRDKNTKSWTFSRFNDPCLAFGMDRKPAQHFVQRLREWLDVSDLLVLASTASSDIGMFTRSKSALDPQNPVIDAFTCTQPPDSRRAAMPMAADGDTSPIGMAIDLSVTEQIPRPIPTDETLEQSPVPLPALYVLNNEGTLNMWYIVYNGSVRQAKPYPDLVAAGGPRPLGDQKPQQASTTPQGASGVSSPFGGSNNAINSMISPFGQQQKPASSFGTSTFGAPRPTSTFGQPSGTAFGGASSASAFGGASAGTAFGGASSLGTKQSPWGSNAASSTTTTPFKQPAFGSSTFGQASGLGMGTNKGSVWGAPSQPQTQQTPSSSSVFGGNTAQSSPFMSLGNQSGNQSAFASAAKSTASPFANAGTSNFSGFAALGKENQASPFGSKPTLSAQPSSGSTVSFGNGTSFGSGSTNFGVTSFQSSPTPTPQQAQSREESMADDDEKSETSTLKAPAPTNTSGAGLFGLGSGGFKLGSTFKADGSAKDDLPKPKDAGAGLFGKSFSASLGLNDSSAVDAKEKTAGSLGGSEAAWMSGASTPNIKKEPGMEEQAKLQDIPAAVPEKEEESPTAIDDAPLPPDPTTWKPKPGALPPPIPPGFGADFVKPAEKAASKAAEIAIPKQQSQKDAGQPLAGSPPVDLVGEKFSDGQLSPVDSDEAAGPPESDGEEEWSDEEGEEDEDEEDEDEDAENRTPKVVDQKGLSAFEARLTPASPKRADQEKASAGTSTTPATDKKDSYTPAGLPKAPIMFPPPQRTQQSPRSPSPQRSATSPVRSVPPTFGSTQHTAANKGLPLKPVIQQPLSQPSQLPPPSQPRTSSLLGSGTGTVRINLTRSPQVPQSAQRIAVPPSQLGRPEKAEPKSQPAAPEQGELVDEEDVRIQAILAAPIEPTRDVPSFLAHQDYVADGREKEGLGGQIERVFRDINSMIDTLALNARSLRGFVEGNNVATQKSRLDLEEEDAWALSEFGTLEAVMRGIDIQLEDGRIEDAAADIDALAEDEKDLGRLRVKLAEARKQIASRTDQDQLAQQHSAPLPMESQAQQSELRQGVQDVQKLLAKAEEQLSVLRAELASLPKNGGGGVDGKSSSSMPSVEAIINTILKMTAMVEQKSGDIDVLEAQIRKLGGPAALGLRKDYEDDLVAGLEASKISHGSPAALRPSHRASVLGTPAMRMRGSRSTPLSNGSSNKKSLFDVSDAEVEAYRVKKEARKQAMERLREQLETRGPRVVRVGR